MLVIFQKYNFENQYSTSRMSIFVQALFWNATSKLSENYCWAFWGLQWTAAVKDRDFAEIWIGIHVQINPVLSPSRFHFNEYRNGWCTRSQQEASVCSLHRFITTVAWPNRSERVTLDLGQTHWLWSKWDRIPSLLGKFTDKRRNPVRGKTLGKVKHSQKPQHL